MLKVITYNQSTTLVLNIVVTRTSLFKYDLLHLICIIGQ